MFFLVFSNLLVRCLFPMLQSFNSLMNWLSREENGQLRVGVRRLVRQQSSMPSSVISSQSMHLGVLATASHAVATQTLFVVYYKPRYGMLLLLDELEKSFLLNNSCRAYHIIDFIFFG